MKAEFQYGGYTFIAVTLRDGTVRVLSRPGVLAGLDRGFFSELPGLTREEQAQRILDNLEEWKKAPVMKFL